ncbi:MAG: hypothetical protein RIR53_1531 [Bacteroidota bacterium]
MKKNTAPLLVLLALVAAASSAGTDPKMNVKLDGADKIRGRFQDYHNRRFGTGQPPSENLRVKALDAIQSKSRKLAAETQAETPRWVQKGPYAVGGRIKTIAFDPVKKDVIYIGAAAGGVWKTTNGGEEWMPMMDQVNAIAMGALCIDPDDPNIIYAGTGEQVINANTYFGCGLMRSTDAGQTWNVFALTNVGAFSRVYIHPKNKNLMMCGTMGASAGVWKSTDKGATWNRVRTGQIYDLSMNPDDPENWAAAVSGEGIVISTDGGATWATRMNGLVGSIGRISVQFAPSQPSTLYCLAELNSLAVVAKSTNAGASWSVQYRDAQGCFFAGACSPDASQGFYDNLVSVDPKNPNRAFVGGIDLWLTTNGGQQWINVTNGYSDGDGANAPHVDQHVVAFDPHTPNMVYAGNDGGMLRSPDGGNSWYLINTNLAVTQFYSFDIDRSARERMYGGTQDNGTLGTEGIVDWERVAGGDGMTTLVHPTIPSLVYGSNPNGALFRLDFGAGRFTRITTGLNNAEECEWVAPVAIDPFNPDAMITGRRRVYLSENRGDLWQATSPIFESTVSAVAFSLADQEVLWAGGRLGDLFVSTDYATTWKRVDQNGLSSAFISDIVCPENDRSTVWISYSSYGKEHVWRTTDLGQTWEPRWTGMPDVPVNSIELHPDDANIVFAGTDVGVFVTFDAGLNWMPYGKDLPRTPILDLKIDIANGYIRAGTHGRSIWEAPLMSVAPADPIIATPIGGEQFVGLSSTRITWRGVPAPCRIEFSIDNGASWRVIVAQQQGSAFSWEVPNAPTMFALVRVTSESNPSIFAVSRPFSIIQLLRGMVISQASVGWIPYGLSYDGKTSLWTTNFRTKTLHKLDYNTLKPVKTVTMQGAGDSLFTDLCYDREKHEIYVHRLESTEGLNTIVSVVDTNGKLLRTFPSAARRYGLGLELVNGVLYGAERDGERRIVGMNPQTGALLSTVSNPFQQFYGPRCLTQDGDGNFLQVCTGFADGGGALMNASIAEIPISNPTRITQSLPLETPNGLINARGVEADVRDNTMWISEYGGTIFKITGLRFEPPPTTSVADEARVLDGVVSIAPHPVSSTSFISVSSVGSSRMITPSITDVTGRTVWTGPSYMQEAEQALVIRIPDDMLGTGTYIASLVAEDGRSVRRTFIVSK